MKAKTVYKYMRVNFFVVVVFFVYFHINFTWKKYFLKI